MPENTVISPFLSSFMTAIFIFSTIWTLAFYYNQGIGQQLQTTGLEDNNNPEQTIQKSDMGILGVVYSVADSILGILSIVNPFGFVILILQEVMKGTPELYQIMNYLILRPVGWIFTIFEINYILSRIPTEHGE